MKEIEEHLSVSDKEFSYGLFHKKTFFAKDAKLFPSGEPKCTDIAQGYTDLDCYFLSVVAGVAKHNPKKIMECFPDYVGRSVDEINKIFSEATKIKIRFFKVRKCESGYAANGKVLIELDKSSCRGKGAPWVRLLEKAYAVYKSKGYDVGSSNSEYKSKKAKIKSRIIDGLYGGDPSSVTVTLTGKSSESMNFKSDSERATVKKFTGNYSPEALDAFDKIKNSIKNKKVVTASASRGYKLYKKGLFLNHCYTVIGTSEKNNYKYVIVRNPYANRSRVYTQDSHNKMHSKTIIPKGKEEKGISELELNDFYKYFSCIDFET